MAVGLAMPAHSQTSAPAPHLADPLFDPAADAATRAHVDPLSVDTADFARARDPEQWRGLTVERIGLIDGAIGWRLWRIANRTRLSGPLWVIPHDDENASFAAALIAVRGWGGVVMAVDAGARDGGYAARFNQQGGAGPAVDPNRVFGSAQPAYTAAMLADRATANRLVVALHANARGYDPALPRCPGEPLVERGSGDISMALCTERMTPRRPHRRLWPFDDDDTLALIPHLTASAQPSPSWCERRLATANFNLVDEAVPFSDGSLSNYAALHGLAYVNFETRDRGNDGAGLVEGRTRLIAMVDRAMELCAPIPRLELRTRKR